MTFWLNGNFREDETALCIADRGFLLGDGVFETLLVDRGALAFLDRHLARLNAGLETLRIQAALPENIGRVFGALAQKNGLARARASARLTVSRGASGRGLAFPEIEEPTVLLTLAAAARPGDASARLIVSSFRRAEASVAARCKTLGYLDNILAKSEARESGADDAVMLNSHGRVACASAANIFILDKGGAATPPVAEGALPGVVRGLLLEDAAEIGVPVAERAVAPGELHSAGLFLTNSLTGLRLARLKDGAAPNTVQTEMFRKLEAWYQIRLRKDLQSRNAGP